MRSGFERTHSDEDAERLDAPHPFEQPLAFFLTDAFRFDGPAPGARYLQHVYRAQDGRLVTVRRYGWEITEINRPDGRTGFRFDARPDTPAGSGVRVGYRISTKRPQSAFEVSTQGAVTPLRGDGEQQDFDAAVSGGRTYVFEHAEPGSQQPPVPVDPATAEQLTTLLYTGTPLQA